MPDYKKMYFNLFNAVTDSLDAIDRGFYRAAAQILKEAQQAGEESFIEERPSRSDSTT